ncbi:hypothetical protein GOV11_04045 [Candidatus Woesearchaeota archaeon]|nr:hypothetical protein [Candidatus Woesearchaeota archaeon]
MGLLPIFMREPVQISKDLTQEEHILHEDLKRFLKSYLIKQDVLQRMMRGEPIYPYIHMLELSLKDEINLIKKGEKVEKEIIYDLKYLSKDQYVKRINDLFKHIQTIKANDQIVFRLLGEIQDVLNSEAHKVHRLSKGDTSGSTVEALKDLFLIEQHLVEKLARVEDFEHLFKELYLGEVRQQTISKIEKRFTQGLLDRMQNVRLGPDGQMQSTDGHYISELAANIFNRLHKTIMESVRDGKIDEHPGVDFEFVNSNFFEDFIRAEIEIDRNSGKMIPSERTMRTFVWLFRQMYNTQATPPPPEFAKEPVPKEQPVI